MNTELEDYRDDYRQIRRECWKITGMTCPDFDQRVRDRMPDDDSRGIPSVWVETARGVARQAIYRVVGEPVNVRAEARAQEQRKIRAGLGRSMGAEELAWYRWNRSHQHMDDAWDERAQDAMERRAGSRY